MNTVGNSISKNGVLIVWKRHHDVIHFSTKGNFYISIYHITNVDIFRLGYILSHSICSELVYIDPFLASVPILYLLKTLGNQNAFNVFRGYKMRTMARNCLIKFMIPRSETAQKISFLACCFRRTGCKRG